MIVTGRIDTALNTCKEESAKKEEKEEMEKTHGKKKCTLIYVCLAYGTVLSTECRFKFLILTMHLYILSVSSALANKP